MSEIESKPSRPRWIVITAAAVVAVLVFGGIVWAVVASGGSQAPGATPTDASTLAPPSPGTEGGATPGATAEPPPGAEAPVPPELEPVSPDEVAVGDDGVRVRIDRIESVEGEAFSAGEIAGPAIRVSVTVENDSDEPLDLGFAVVNAYVGPDRAPAGTVTQPGGVRFAGVLAPGESGTGVSLFTIAEADRDDVTITVDYSADVSTVVFQGAVG